MNKTRKHVQSRPMLLHTLPTKTSYPAWFRFWWGVVKKNFILQQKFLQKEEYLKPEIMILASFS